MRCATGFGALLLTASFVACGVSPGDTGDTSDATIPDAVSTDAQPTSCELLDTVEIEAQRAASAIAAEAEADGLIPVALGYGQPIDLSWDEYQYALDSDLPFAELYPYEMRVLALPPEDGLRQAYESGELTPPDWSTEALLVLWEWSPYTDWHVFFREPNGITIYPVRLEACLSPGGHEFPPTESLERRVYRVPFATGMRTYYPESVAYRMPYFAPEPAWSRHPDSPFVHRQGGNQSVAQTADGFGLWLNGYSGATGFIFRATSSDGIAWDFAWDSAHECTFDGPPPMDVWRRDPAVVESGGSFTMWYTMLDPVLGDERLYRSVSTEGLNWTDERVVRVTGGLQPTGRAAPYVLRDGATYHLWAHTSGQAILHATSVDGIDFTADTTPALGGEPGAESMDNFGVYLPAVLPLGDQWVMFYTAHQGARDFYQAHIAVAVSDDGTTWHKTDSPVLSQFLEPGHWEADSFGRAAVLSVSDMLHLYYTGVEGGEPSVGLATATGWSP